MQEGFHERILHRFVYLSRIPQVVVGDSRGTPLMQRDDIGKLLPGFGGAPGAQQLFNRGRDSRIAGPRQACRGRRHYRHT